MGGRRPYRRKGSGAQSRPEGLFAQEKDDAMRTREQAEGVQARKGGQRDEAGKPAESAEDGGPAGGILHAGERQEGGEEASVAEHAPSVEGADVEPPPAPVPNKRKYVVNGPDGRQHVTYNAQEAREYQAFGRLLRKRKR